MLRRRKLFFFLAEDASKSSGTASNSSRSTTNYNVSRMKSRGSKSHSTQQKRSSNNRQHNSSSQISTSSHMQAMLLRRKRKEQMEQKMKNRNNSVTAKSKREKFLQQSGRQLLTEKSKVPTKDAKQDVKQDDTKGGHDANKVQITTQEEEKKSLKETRDFKQNGAALVEKVNEDEVQKVKKMIKKKFLSKDLSIQNRITPIDITPIKSNKSENKEEKHTVSQMEEKRVDTLYQYDTASLEERISYMQTTSSVHGSIHSGDQASVQISTLSTYAPPSPVNSPSRSIYANSDNLSIRSIYTNSDNLSIHSQQSLSVRPKSAESATIKKAMKELELKKRLNRLSRNDKKARKENEIRNRIESLSIESLHNEEEKEEITKDDASIKMFQKSMMLKDAMIAEQKKIIEKMSDKIETLSHHDNKSLPSQVDVKNWGNNLLGPLLRGSSPTNSDEGLYGKIMNNGKELDDHCGSEVSSVSC